MNKTNICIHYLVLTILDSYLFHIFPDPDLNT
jgi:hypothetical protein